MQLMSDVGKSAVNNAADVWLVQWAFSEIEAHVKGARTPKATRFWQRSEITGKSSSKFIEAIKAYQKHKNLQVVGKVIPGGATLKAIRADAPRLRDFVVTFGGVIKRSKLEGIQKRSRAISRLILIQAPLLRDEASDLSKLVLAAAKFGLDVVLHENGIDRLRGCFTTSLYLLLEGYIFPSEEKAYKKLSALFVKHSSSTWTAIKNNPMKLSSQKKYDFLKPGKHKISSVSLKQLGLSSADYNQDPVVATLTDALTRILNERSNDRGSLSDRKKLAAILYPMKPNAARLMLSLYANGRTISEVGNVFPLYRLGATVFLPRFKLIGDLSLSFHLILNPNNQKEYLLLSLNAEVNTDILKLGRNSKRIKSMLRAAPKAKWTLDSQIEPIPEAISDFETGSIEFAGEANVKFVSEPYVIEFGVYKEAWKLARPKVFDVPSDGIVSGSLLPQEGSVSSKKNFLEETPVDVFEWDLGTVKLSVRTAGRDEETEFNVRGGANLKFFFDIDADFWDPVLYSSISDVSDLIVLASER